jgi:hypothetical protein
MTLYDATDSFTPLTLRSSSWKTATCCSLRRLKLLMPSQKQLTSVRGVSLLTMLRAGAQSTASCGWVGLGGYRFGFVAGTRAGAGSPAGLWVRQEGHADADGSVISSVNPF